MKIKKILIPCLSLLLLITGCKRYLNEEYLSSDDIHEYGWALEEEKYVPPDLYCYRTIGKSDCYKHPQGQRRNQLIASYENKQRQHEFYIEPIKE